MSDEAKIVINTGKGFFIELIEKIEGKSLINMKWETSITLFLAGKIRIT